MCSFNQENLLQLPIIINQYSGPSWECSWMFKPGSLHGADGQQGYRPHGRGVWQGGPGKHIQWSAYIYNYGVGYWNNDIIQLFILAI